MELCEKNKLFIFNLCESTEVPIRTLIRIFYNCDIIDEYSIKKILGNTPKCKLILDLFNDLDTSFLSIYSLISDGINIYTIEYLKNSFSSINDIANNSNKLSQLHFQEKTISKIQKFISDNLDLIYSNVEVLERDIYKYIDSLDSAQKSNELYVNLINDGIQCSPQEYYGAINNLIQKNKIKVSSTGIEKKLPVITEVFNDNSDKKMELLKQYLQGDSIITIAKENGVTRQRIDQLIKSIIFHLPIFDNELKYKKTLSIYKIDDDVLLRYGFDDLLLINYVKAKYDLKPYKNSIDFILDNRLVDTELGAMVLEKNNLINLDGKIYKIDFKTMFDLYTAINNYHSFKSAEIYNDFLFFLESKGISAANFNIGDQILFKRKIDNIGYYLSCGDDVFIKMVEEDLSDDFIMKSRAYLELFYGYGSVYKFYKDNTQLCKDNYISDEHQLFSVLKKLYSKEFKDDIEFIRNPTIITKGLNKKIFFGELISSLQPIKVNKFIKYLSNEYGLLVETIKANQIDWFGEFIGKNNELSTTIREINIHDNHTRMVLDIFNDREIIQLEEYTKKVKSFELPDSDFYLNKFVISRLGYRYTNDVLYKNSYGSIYEALLGLSNVLPICISQEKIQEYIPLYYVDSRYYSGKQNCIFLRFSDYSFINIMKRANHDEVINFRNELISGLELDEIYTINDLIDSVNYTRLKNKYTDVVKMVESMGYLLLRSIIESSLEITSINDNSVFVFGKGQRVSIKRLIKRIVEKYGSIEKGELLDMLSRKYGVENDFSNSYFLELGLYYNSITNKVYETKEICDNELIHYLEEERNNEMD